ncbi:MAG TPA: TetR/AcrR family transcriptional regulator [Kutzneria sp.]|nr:TetR/AcrR family transcriptional regulator [Kutzneria sp.]
MTDSYHHGDLRRQVLTAAAEVIAERGVAAVSLRDLARQAGVSHAAPAHHFGNRTGLLTALAAEGFERLAAELGAADGLKEMGVAYVRFALDHPAHFRVMFDSDLLDADNAELVAARAKARQKLRAGVDGRPEQALAAWSLAHGFATLRLGGNVTGEDAAAIFRGIAETAFNG